MRAFVNLQFLSWYLLIMLSRSYALAKGLEPSITDTLDSIKKKDKHNKTLL